ncbi:MAG: ssl1498 family light-harvesting-like protein [Desertifilum sp. SIO1I2]|nr:ssl1498 family light-harvesting-like protein [Desertifilum sp. SIO1I2]
MPYINEEGGRLNNYAVEPKMYRATPPTKNQQQKYIVMGLGAVALVGGLVFVAFSVSGLG